MTDSSHNIRVSRHARRLIEAVNLDLADLVVYTEAATGAYCVTAGLAAMGGAKHVFALARDSRFGNAQDAADITLEFARLGGVEDCIQIVFEKNASDLAQADIVTNSGHVRPIDEATVLSLKPTAAIPLMYEAWEFRPKDVDIAACRKRGIPVAGINETHPVVGILDYLGMMAIKLLLDGNIEIVGTRIALWSNNKFCGYVASALASMGAEVLVSCPPDLLSSLPDSHPKIKNAGDLAQLPKNLSEFQNVDIVMLVMSPDDIVWIGNRSQAVIAADKLAGIAPGATIAQYWGIVDRQALAEVGLPVLPLREPPPQHMGILPSDLGLVPILRLQTGGLKVGEIMARARANRIAAKEAEQYAVNAGFGQHLMVSY